MRWLAFMFALSGCRSHAGESSSLPLELASARGVAFDLHEEAPPSDHDPVALATASAGRIANPDASIPPQCYARTDGLSNPCHACHTHSTYPNLTDDWELQQNYSFTGTAKINHWRNQFRDRTALVAGISDVEVLAYVRRDNYTPLRAWSAAHPEATSWRPDLDFTRGFDHDGFANDGTSWRALRYKPFPGAFWATNGSADDVFVRLPVAFQRARDGTPSREVYRANLAILEAAIAGDPRRGDAELAYPIERVDERAAGVDLDGDHALAFATRIAQLPASYAGAAADRGVRRGLYPEGTEFLHTVRYLDPDRPGLAATRIKEVRYMVKATELSERELVDAYARAESNPAPIARGEPRAGVANGYGWRLQGWIEDARGWLRLQTQEEHEYCVGCHANLGITVDQTFAFARKVPGLAGWRPQDPTGIPDVPALGEREAEYAAYLERVAGGDELHANTEMLASYFRDDVVLRDRVDATRRDIGLLISPSRVRAIALDRAYLANVIEQSYVWGREPTVVPLAHAQERIDERSTGLGERDRVYRFARIQLDWATLASQ